MDALLPDFLDLSRGGAGEAGYADAGLYLALRGWPAPGREAEPLSLRRAPASVVWAQGARLLLRAPAGQLTSSLCSWAGRGAFWQSARTLGAMRSLRARGPWHELAVAACHVSTHHCQLSGPSLCT